jgi:hypothetical protein
MKHIISKYEKSNLDQVSQLEKSIKSFEKNLKQSKCSFLPITLTATEEIYSEEDNYFVEKIKSNTNSPNKIRSFLFPSQLERPKTKNATSPIEKNLNTSSTLNPSNLSKLPTIRKSTRCLCKNIGHEDFNNKKDKRRLSIDKIVKVYEKSLNETARSQNLENFISKHRKIAKEYTNHIDWASEKLKEINGLDKDLMKKVFLEYKDYKKIYENEKTEVIADYNSKSSSYGKNRVKSLKKMLKDFKDRIIY